MKKNSAQKIALTLISVAIVSITSIFSYILFQSLKKEQIANSEIILRSKVEPVIKLLEKIETENPSGTLSGVDLKELRDIISDTIYYESGFPYILSYKGIIQVHPFSESNNVKEEIFFDKIIASDEQEDIFSITHDGIEKTFYFKNLPKFKSYLVLSADFDEVYSLYSKFKIRLLIISLVVCVLLFLSIKYILTPLFSSLKIIEQNLKKIENNVFETVEIEFPSSNFANINNSFKNTCDHFAEIAELAEKISKGELLNEKERTQTNDSLRNSLIRIEENIRESRREQEERRKEDEKTNWVNTGLAKFGEILRMHTDNFERQADNIIQNLVRYVNANQGGLFILNSEDKENIYLELASAFAYDTKKFMEKIIPYGEGLVGTCAIEKETIYIKDVPEEYIEITSGLGEAPPSCILLVPIKMEDEVLGIIEIASFDIFEEHEIAFIEKIMESVASTLSAAKINARTNELLQKFELQSNDMAEKEEEMRQNIEELQATQEEASRKEAKMMSYMNAFSNTLMFIEYNIEGEITDINENFCNFLGETKDDLLGRTISEQVTTKTANIDKLERTWQKLIDGESLSIKSEYIMKDIQYVLTETYSCITDGFGRTEKILRTAVLH